MRNLKKVMALILVFALSLTMMASAAYTDVAVGAASGDAIGLLSAMGVFKGYTNGEFRPENKITRAEVSTIIYRMLTNDVVASVSNEKTQFPDVPQTHWASGYVKYSTSLKPAVILGRTNGNFDPEANITIAEVATLLVRALGYEEIITVDEGLARAYELGISTISVGGSNAATRAEVAQMAGNALFCKFLRNNSTVTLAKAVFNMTPYNSVVLATGDTTEIRATEKYEVYSTADDLLLNFFNSEYMLLTNIWSLMKDPVYRDAKFAYKTDASLFGHGVIAYIVDSNKDNIINSYDKLVYIQKAAYSKETTALPENIGYLEKYTLETAPYVSYVGNNEFTYVNVNGYAAGAMSSAANAALITYFMESAMHVEYKFIDNDNDGKVEIAFITISFNAGKLGNSYDTYGGVEISPIVADGATPYTSYVGNGVTYDNGVDWGKNLAYYEQLLPGSDRVIYSYQERNASYELLYWTDASCTVKTTTVTDFPVIIGSYSGFMSSINRPNMLPAIMFENTSGIYVKPINFGTNNWQIDGTFRWGSTGKRNDSDTVELAVTGVGQGLIPFARIADWGNAVEGDWVIATPVWDSATKQWNYKLSKAETVTGLCTFVNFSAGLGNTIQLDGKDYLGLIGGYTWNYGGYIPNGSEKLIFDRDHDGKYEELDGDIMLQKEYGTSFSNFGTVGDTNLKKSFTLIMNKNGTKFWKAIKTPISSNEKGIGNYGIITAIGSTAVNLKADDYFAEPDWTVLVKMLDESGVENTYRTTVTSTSGPGYHRLQGIVGTEFIKYILLDVAEAGKPKDERLTLRYWLTDEEYEHLEDEEKDPLAPGYSELDEVQRGIVVDHRWDNIMSVIIPNRYTFKKDLSYFTNVSTTDITGAKFGMNSNTVIFAFTDTNGNGQKDKEEAASVIKYADLVANNVSIYADDTNYDTFGNFMVKCVVIKNYSGTSAGKTTLGKWSSTQARSYVDGKVTDWTITFDEISGTKSYTCTTQVLAGFLNPWGTAGKFIYMYTVGADNKIIAFHPWDTDDYARPAGFNGFYSMQIAGFYRDNYLGVEICDVFYEDVAFASTVDEYVATIRGTFIIDTSTKIKFLEKMDGFSNSVGAFGNMVSAGGRAGNANPYYDFEQNFNFFYYDRGWMKYETNDQGNKVITELYLGNPNLMPVTPIFPLVD